MKKKILFVTAFLMIMMILSGFVLEKDHLSADTGKMRSTIHRMFSVKMT